MGGQIIAAILVSPISSFTTGVSSHPSSFLFTNKESANSWSEYKHQELISKEWALLLVDVHQSR
jgi:hypothetical protein